MVADRSMSALLLDEETTGEPEREDRPLRFVREDDTDAGATTAPPRPGGTPGANPTGMSRSPNASASSAGGSPSGMNRTSTGSSAGGGPSAMSHGPGASSAGGSPSSASRGSTPSATTSPSPDRPLNFVRPGSSSAPSGRENGPRTLTPRTAGLGALVQPPPGHPVIPGLGAVHAGTGGATKGLVHGVASQVIAGATDPRGGRTVDPKLVEVAQHAQENPAIYGADVLLKAHNPQRYAELAQAGRLPSHVLMAHDGAGRLDEHLRDVHRRYGEELRQLYGDRPVPERAILGLAAAAGAHRDVERSIDVLHANPEYPARTAFGEIVRDFRGPEVARVATAFRDPNPEVAVEAYRTAREGREAEHRAERRRILDRLRGEWVGGGPQLVPLFEGLVREWSPEQGERLRAELQRGGNIEALWEEIEEQNARARLASELAAFRRWHAEWEANRHPKVQTPLDEPQTVVEVVKVPEPKPEIVVERVEVAGGSEEEELDGSERPLTLRHDAASDTDATDTREESDESDTEATDTHEESDTGYLRAFRPGAYAADGLVSWGHLTQGFGPAAESRLRDAWGTGREWQTYRDILAVRGEEATAARERAFRRRLEELGCDRFGVCRVPRERIVELGDLGPHFAPEQWQRLTAALTEGQGDPVAVWRAIERENLGEAVAVREPAFLRYLGARHVGNPGVWAREAPRLGRVVLDEETSGILDALNATLGAAGGARSEGPPVDLGASIGQSLTSIFGGNGSTPPALGGLDGVGARAFGSPALSGQLGTFAKDAVAALTGRQVAVPIGPPPAPVAPVAARVAPGVDGPPPAPIAARVAPGVDLRAALAPWSGLPFADLGARVVPALAAIGLTGPATALPHTLLRMVPSVPVGADPAGWWGDLTAGQGLGQSASEALKDAIDAGGPEGVQHAVALYQQLVEERLRQQMQERTTFFARVLDAARRSAGPAFDPRSLPGGDPFAILAQGVGPAWAEVDHAIQTGVDPVGVFRRVEGQRFNQQLHVDLPNRFGQMLATLWQRRREARSAAPSAEASGSETGAVEIVDRGFARPRPLFHLSFGGPMPEHELGRLLDVVPELRQHPDGVLREMAGLRSQARDVRGVDATTGEYVLRPGEDHQRIAEKLVGDRGRWRELQAANPGGLHGLTRARIPPGWFGYVPYRIPHQSAQIAAAVLGGPAVAIGEALAGAFRHRPAWGRRFVDHRGFGPVAEERFGRRHVGPFAGEHGGRRFETGEPETDTGGRGSGGYGGHGGAYGGGHHGPWGAGGEWWGGPMFVEGWSHDGRRVPEDQARAYTVTEYDARAGSPRHVVERIVREAFGIGTAAASWWPELRDVNPDKPVDGTGAWREIHVGETIGIPENWPEATDGETGAIVGRVFRWQHALLRNANLHTGPGHEFPFLRTIAAGTRVRVPEKAGGWSRIVFTPGPGLPGMGWVRSALVGGYEVEDITETAGPLDDLIARGKGFFGFGNAPPPAAPPEPAEVLADELPPLPDDGPQDSPAAMAHLNTGRRPALTRATYTVKRGDFPAKIAKRLGVASRPHWLSELLACNPHKPVDSGLGNFYRLDVGEVINLPDAWKASADTSGDDEEDEAGALTTRQNLTQTTYLVLAGDTMVGIATKFGATSRPWFRELRDANPQKPVAIDPVTKKQTGWQILNPGEIVNIPDAWVAHDHPEARPAPGGVVSPSPMPGLDQFPPVPGLDATPASTAPIGFIPAGATIDPGTLQRVLAILTAWGRAHPNDIRPRGFGSAGNDNLSRDLLGVPTKRMQEALQSFARWSNGTTGSHLREDGLLDPDTLKALASFSAQTLGQMPAGPPVVPIPGGSPPLVGDSNPFHEVLHVAQTVADRIPPPPNVPLPDPHAGAYQPARDAMERVIEVVRAGGAPATPPPRGESGPVSPPRLPRGESGPMLPPRAPLPLLPADLHEQLGKLGIPGTPGLPDGAPHAPPRGESGPLLPARGPRPPRGESGPMSPPRPPRGESGPMSPPRLPRGESGPMSPPRLPRGESGPMSPPRLPRGESGPMQPPHDEAPPEAAPKKGDGLLPIAAGVLAAVSGLLPRILLMSFALTPRATWTHRDSAPKETLVAALAPENYLRPDGSRPMDVDRVRLVRALGMATAYAVENATVRGVPPLGEMETRTLGQAPLCGEMFVDREHCYAASTIARTFQVLAGPGPLIILTATTLDGQRAVASPPPSSETGFPPLLLGAVMMVATVAFYGAICFVAQKIAAVEDRTQGDDALTARLMATQARAVALVDNHHERERATGRSLPYDEGETKLLDALTGAQRDLAQRQGTPFPDPFQGAVDSVRTAVNKVGTGLEIGTVLALGVAAYVITR